MDKFLYCIQLVYVDTHIHLYNKNDQGLFSSEFTKAQVAHNLAKLKASIALFYLWDYRR